ncbi:MAG TPA: transposase [Pyrinomonadaceae bacterium]|nr:transposase [Pyrinomonadaceae bacterium]
MNEPVTENYPLAYLITIRSYGSWLHGDEKGSIDRHGFNVYGTPRMFQSEKLKNFMKQEMREEPVCLDKNERICVLAAIKEVCDFRGYELYAVNIRTNHLHAVVSANTNPEKIINEFKAYATRRLRESKLIERDKTVWARGKSRRYLWKPRHVGIAVDYVLFGQGDEIPEFD